MGLEIVEFQMQIEEHFGFDIPPEDGDHLTTVKSACDYIINKKRLEGQELEFQEVFTKVKKMIERTGYAEDNKIEINSRFNEDLGFD